MAVYWIIGFLGILVGILALYNLYRNMKKVDSDLRVFFILTFIAAFVYMVYSTATFALGYRGIVMTHYLWKAVPILFLITSVSWASATFMLMKLVSSFDRTESGVTAMMLIRAFGRNNSEMEASNE